MKKSIAKGMFAAMLFTVAFLGVKLTRNNIKVANEQGTQTTFTLGQQAQAYCNEKQYDGETLTGKCDGAFNSFLSRCMASLSMDCTS